ncbi:uncharacterized protein AMSG_08992 [Thecamonas trahens ATCC 50062]|uniref:Sorting nexin n=1 Tax=Thecamonas trahens ATCC 50062 TaxID=461836 RepID=A0A0L0DKT6_THETB|nr:hypothetical protein AMSG_08992 [Thecamonas trahens ATCC 50062]KNC52845.1 hypothetical protein AMSG_08992 [Thecamonas trahens ATCC 50062]|eukprot:XP_013754948.1 hypothetical protein AMSG_08992 [Thecamonas trahens ATCC 50062]
MGTGMGMGDLSFYEGEVITVVTEDPGDGWTEGEVNGSRGFFPTNYVEVIVAESASSAPPAPPAKAHAKPMPSLPHAGGGETSSGPDAADAVIDASALAASISDVMADGGDDAGWETSDSSEDGWGETGTGASGQSGASAPAVPARSTLAAPSPATARERRLSTDMSRRLSVLDAPTVEIDEQNRISAGFEWVAEEAYFSIKVANPEKKKKFGGLKKYTAYVVETPARGWRVLRRYKHFDWLHERLEKKYTAIAIPPLPEKSATGRFNEDFIEERRMGLTYFLNTLARHPVLRSSAVFLHFLSVDNSNDDTAWKAGKRQHEKDAVSGENWFFSVAPAVAVEGQAVVPVLETFSKDLNSELTLSSTLEKQLEGWQTRWSDDAKALSSLAETYATLAQVDEGVPTLQAALAACAQKVASISQLSLGASQAEDIMLRTLALHRTKMKLLQKALKVEQSARTRYVSAYSKVNGREPTPEESVKLEVLRSASNRKMCVALAEMAHYRLTRKVDFKNTLLGYIREQEAFHAKAGEAWAAARATVEAIDVDEHMFDA